MADQKVDTLDRIVRILISAGMLAGLIWLAGYLSDVLIPFAVALLLVYYRQLIASAPPAASNGESKDHQ